MLVAIVDGEPTPITEFGAGDAALWAILARGLAKDPDQRFQTIRQVGEALATWLGDKRIKQDITGASLDATWRNGIRGTSLETLNSLPPPANEETRGGVETVFDAAPAPRPAAPGGAPSRAILAVAALAGVIGIAAGVSIGTRFLKGRAEPAGKQSLSAVPSSASGAARAGAPLASQSAAQMPTSEATNERRNAATAASSATESSSQKEEKETKSVRGSVTRTGKREKPAVKRPPPALKDPFE
jgi:serine/threonine-protein kinase